MFLLSLPLLLLSLKAEYDTIAYTYRFPITISFFHKALVMQEKTLGPLHSSVAETLVDMARLLATQSRYQEAESFYQRALAMYDYLMGADHPDVASMSAEYNDILKQLR